MLEECNTQKHQAEVIGETIAKEYQKIMISYEQIKKSYKKQYKTKNKKKKK